LYARADPAAGADPRQPDVLLALPYVVMSAAAGRTGGIFRDDRRYAAHEPAAALRRGPNQRGPRTLPSRRLCVVTAGDRAERPRLAQIRWLSRIPCRDRRPHDVSHP